MGASFQTGLDTLLAERADLLTGRRVGLLAHPASVDSRGVHAAQRLHDEPGVQLTALFGPEHGFFGGGGAGDAIAHARHPAWDIPIHSLYGDQRRPTPEMLRDVDALVFDLQDLAVRCYTFVTTLRYVLEEAARSGTRVIVCDRPVPFPGMLDGPMLDAGCESFVSGVPAPLVYGMTPGEAAQWLKHVLNLDVDLHVAAMQGWRRGPHRAEKTPWISPSPGIRSWETAWCYPATVGFEALPAVDYGRGSLLPFQVVTAPFIDAETFCAALNRLRLKGVAFQPHWQPSPGARLVVTNPRVFRPVTTGVAILHTLQSLYGAEKIWSHPGTREDFFDKLMGTSSVRESLKNQVPWKKIVNSWRADTAAFDERRTAHLLY